MTENRMGDGGVLSERLISARIERLPTSPWHVRMRVIIGTATFFDAFDSVAIAAALPALVSLWHLSPKQVGTLISVGFGGQAIGAISIGYFAEHRGRIAAAQISIALFGAASLLCALASSYNMLLLFRFLQGFGLGSEVPVAATYINEIAKAKARGRFFLFYECVFLFGIVSSAAAGAFIVPFLGYRWIFVAGGIPALLVLLLLRWCPESPRWLASRGRLHDADRTLSEIERQVARYAPLPPVVAEDIAPVVRAKTQWKELFQGFYRRRTLVVWVLWFTAYLVSYGLVTWMPTIYRTIYKVSVQQALLFGISASLFGLIGGLICAVLIDRSGRRTWMASALALASLPLLALAWFDHSHIVTAVILASLGNAAVTTVTIVLYLYTPEIYPTRMRALGTSWATFWPRVASMLGAWLVAAILPGYGIRGIFLLFGGVSLVGSVACWWGAIETRNKVLEEISP